MFQGDGNLVIYKYTNPNDPCDINRVATWASGTNSMAHSCMWGLFTCYEDGKELCFTNSQFIISQGGDFPDPTWMPWSVTGSLTGHYAVMQDDGNFVIYDSRGNAMWAAH